MISSSGLSSTTTEKLDLGWSNSPFCASISSLVTWGHRLNFRFFKDPLYLKAVYVTIWLSAVIRSGDLRAEFETQSQISDNPSNHWVQGSCCLFLGPAFQSDLSKHRSHHAGLDSHSRCRPDFFLPSIDIPKQMLGLSVFLFCFFVRSLLDSWLPVLVTHLFLWRHTALFFELGKTLPATTIF